ncbi:hypothetical protein AC249_AIPGENE18017 [Exaiptasia diaphana]|nr:hypothetical protein AC249_AIPGENE18017 [Exaiptasia diaphana]
MVNGRQKAAEEKDKAEREKVTEEGSGTSSSTCQAMVVVRGISHEAILGTDFFEANGCKICYDLGTFCIKDSEIPIHYQKSKPAICGLVLAENVEIDPGTELSITAKLEQGFERNDGTPGMVEGINQSCSNGAPALARTLILPRNGKAVIRMANFTDDKVTLKANRTIGRFYPLHQNTGSVSAFEVKTSQLSDSYQSSNDVKEDEHSENVHELSEAQKSEFSALLEEFKDIIAEDAGDLGMIELIEHKIDTGNATPIK